MWILLTKKIHTVISPPKLSIFWSTPWPMNAKKRETPWPWGIEYGYEDARKILYKRENIRVFPEEFTKIETDKLIEWINEGLFNLVPADVSDDELIKIRLTKGRRLIYDAALVDGCTDAQATMVALGKDPTIENAEIPAIGWYKCKNEYARYFCYENDMTE